MKNILSGTVDLNEFNKELANLNEEQLLALKEKLSDKLCVNYYVVGKYGEVTREKMNISQKDLQKSRILCRREVSNYFKLISSYISKLNVDYSSCWSWINDKFVANTYMPSGFDSYYVKHNFPLADKLGPSGLKAYCNYLMLIYNNLQFSNGGDDFYRAVSNAHVMEVKADKDLDRTIFFARHVLPKDVSTVRLLIEKEELVNERLKKLSTKEDGLKKE